MAVPLRPNGNDLPLGNGIVLRTPGLRGRATLTTLAPGGPTRSDLATATFDETLASNGFRATHIVEIENAIPAPTRPPGSPRTRSGEPAFEIVVPAPAPDFGQAVLVTDEDGVSTWSFAPVEAAATARRGAPGTRTYTLRATVPPPGTPGLAADRGLIGRLGKKVVRVLLFPLEDAVGKVADFFAAKWEAQNRPYRVRSFTPDDYRSATPSRAVDWEHLGGGRTLLLLHGTFSRAHSAFGRLPAAFVEHLHNTYEGRVFAFDHFTVSDDPLTNVKRLLAAVPADVRLDLDILSHSRGGLVARTLAEAAAELGPGSERVTVHRVAFAATPNAGTVLADGEHWGELVDAFTNLLEFFPDNGVTDALEVVLTVVKQLAVGAFGGLEGLEAMDPDSAFLKRLNRADAALSAAHYAAIASDFEPLPGAEGLAVAKDLLFDVLFNAKNDLVVPTDGIFGANGCPSFPIDDVLHLPPERGIAHSAYFGEDDVLDFLAQLFTMAGPPAMADGGEVAAPGDAGDVPAFADGDEVAFLPPDEAPPAFDDAPASGDSEFAFVGIDPKPPFTNGGPFGGGGGTGTGRGSASRGSRTSARAEPRRRAATPTEVPARAFGMLRAPGAAVPGEPFEITIGLAAQLEQGMVGREVTIPPRFRGGYTLTMQVVAEGFQLKKGRSWKVNAKVTPARPFPQRSLELTALPQAEAVVSRTVTVFYSIDGEAIGFAKRPIVVVNPEAVAAPVEPPPVPARPPTTMPIPPAGAAPDVTWRIQRSLDGHQLLWSFDAARGLGLTVPAKPVNRDLDASPEAFAVALMEEADAQSGTPGFFDAISGAGTHIRDIIPREAWKLLQGAVAAAAQEGRSATLLILTDEPHIPWELARLPDSAEADVLPPFDPALPPFLGAQVAVGRWMLVEDEPPRPAPPAAEQRAAGRIAVVFGDYRGSGLAQLDAATEEAGELIGTYGARPVDAKTTALREALRQRPGADILHFAVHGVFDHLTTNKGLLLTDGLTFTPARVRAQRLPQRPLIFLNACQVGTAESVLGGYAGLAEAFLYAGAAAVVAPLWKVHDGMAKEWALRFYEQAARGDVAPAELVRGERARFTHDSEAATPIAYQFYGHPCATWRVTR